MFRALVLTAAASAVMLSAPANAQRVDDPVSLEEVLEEMLKSPYYGTTSSGYGRAQRPYIDKFPLIMLSGGDRYTNVKYFKGTGKIMTDLQDMTVYATTRDTDFKVSSLSGDDLEKWKPIIVPEVSYLNGPWGKAWNESLQAWVLTLVDKPLYRFTGDEEPGEAKGHGGDFYKLDIIG